MNLNECEKFHVRYLAGTILFITEYILLYICTVSSLERRRKNRQRDTRVSEYLLPDKYYLLAVWNFLVDTTHRSTFGLRSTLTEVVQLDTVKTRFQSFR